MEKTHWKKLHNPDYLGAYSLDQNGKYIELQVVIESVTKKPVKGPDGKDEECIIANLKGNKPMILNATNCKTLAKLFNSPHIEDWTNKKITIYVAKIKAFGDLHDALRIKPELPKKPTLTPDHAKWSDAKLAISNGNTTIEAIEAIYILSPENKNLLCLK